MIKHSRVSPVLLRVGLALVAAAISATGTAADVATCRVVDPELQGQYSGGCVNGLAEGAGSASGVARYDGQFKAGRKHGKGVEVWPTGDRYEGEFSDDRKEGRGIYVWGSGTPWAGEKYSGSFRNDKREGAGTYEWPDGERYTGVWKADRVAGTPTPRMLARQHDERVRLAAVSKVGATVCRKIPVGSVVQDWVWGRVASVNGEELRVRIVDPGQFEHRVQGVVVEKGVTVSDWALMWVPCTW